MPPFAKCKFANRSKVVFMMNVFKQETKEGKVLFIDTNLGLEFARRMAKDGYETYYAVVSGDPYPKLEDTIGGLGFEDEGVKKIDDWGDEVSDAEVIVFTDVGMGGLADYLRSDGFAVFGADKVSENLELDRVFARRVFSKLGIPIAKGEILKGVNAVVDYIKKSGKKCYVKINKVRGSIETFGTSDPEEARIMLEQAGFNVIANDVTFVVEHELEGVEVGVDTWFNGKDFLPIVAETIEMKGSGNLTKFVELENSVWYDNLMKLRDFLARNGYRGMICFEGFYDGSKVHVIDPTCRFPYICGYAYPKVIKNFSEVIVGVAKGEYVEPKPTKKYSCQVGVYTDDNSVWREIHFPEEIADRLAFRRVIKKNNSIWFVPGDYVVAVAISEADTPEGAMIEARDIAKKVSAINIYEQSNVLIYEFRRRIEKLKELGYEF